MPSRVPAARRSPASERHLYQRANRQHAKSGTQVAPALTQTVADLLEVRGHRLARQGGGDAAWFDVGTKGALPLARLARQLKARGNIAVRGDFIRLRRDEWHGAFLPTEKAVCLDFTSFVDGLGHSATGPHELRHAWRLWRTKPYAFTGWAKAPDDGQLPGPTGAYAQYISIEEADTQALSARIDVQLMLRALRADGSLPKSQMAARARTRVVVGERTTKVLQQAMAALKAGRVSFVRGSENRVLAKFELDDGVLVYRPVASKDLEVLKRELRWSWRACLHAKGQFELAADVLKHLPESKSPEHTLMALQRVLRSRDIERDPDAVIGDVDDHRKAFEAHLAKLGATSDAPPRDARTARR